MWMNPDGDLNKMVNTDDFANNVAIAGFGADDDLRQKC